MQTKRGGFTIPGQSGYEELTLELAERWGADVIRDSDGTDLSPAILDAGFDIYSTICIIREHNDWAKDHPGSLQQTFLMTPPEVAVETTLTIELLTAYSTGQFNLNTTADAIAYWQVFDRTDGREHPRDLWTYQDGTVRIDQVKPFHSYTVNFLAWRIWEEISMYNHITNDWGAKEHLVPLDPIYPQVQEYLLRWLDSWCREHPQTSVVRFTSLFYNFVWIWGSSDENRNLFTDWASYDFTVSPRALKQFKEVYGYSLCSEDFINGGALQVTHMPPTQAKLDWMSFIQDFVLDFGQALVDLVHSYGKKAYVFYDDSWVGLEPYGSHFPSYGFDGLIKCVFSGYEARMCAEAPGKMTRELRLHPYLFPTGLGGLPTFAPGGDPTQDAQMYWVQIRRALLRKPVDRIGLGGYLSLTTDYPDFVDCISTIASEFRLIKGLHETAPVETMPRRVAILHVWGSLRSWTLSGHFHESDRHPLIHINEALAGLPVDVSFINFDDVLGGALSEFDVVINAGASGSAWSGGEVWANPNIISTINRWVYEGGIFIGVDEPSSLDGYDHFFRLSSVLGVDLDRGSRVNHGRWPLKISASPYTLKPSQLKPKKDLYLMTADTSVLAAQGDDIILTRHQFGAGIGAYFAGFSVNAENTALLMEIICDGQELPLRTNNIHVEAARYGSKVVLVNNTAESQSAVLSEGSGEGIVLKPYAMVIFDLDTGEIQTVE